MIPVKCFTNIFLCFIYSIPNSLSFSCIDKSVVTSLHVNRYSLVVSCWLFKDVVCLSLLKVSTDEDPQHAAMAFDSINDVQKVM